MSLVAPLISTGSTAHSSSELERFASPSSNASSDADCAEVGDSSSIHHHDEGSGSSSSTVASTASCSSAASESFMTTPHGHGDAATSTACSIVSNNDNSGDDDPSMAAALHLSDEQPGGTHRLCSGGTFMRSSDKRRGITAAHATTATTTKTQCQGSRRRPKQQRQRRNRDDPFDEDIDEFDFDEHDDDDERVEDELVDEDTVSSSSSLSAVDRDLEEGGRTSPSSPVTQSSARGICGANGSLAAIARRQSLPCSRRPRHTMGRFGTAWSNETDDAGTVGNQPTSASSIIPSTPSKSHAKSHHDPLILFGLDLSSQPPSVQFFLCSCGVFAFTIVYGYLQELLAVHIAGRKFGLFLATCQFGGYAFWSFLLTRVRAYRQQGGSAASGGGSASSRSTLFPCSSIRRHTSSGRWTIGPSSVPLRTYIALSLVRALDLGMTNLAMQFLNYPAKTLIKSSRVVFTMLLGLVIGGKRYRCRDYLAVSLLVAGLGIFLHADSRSKTVFHPLGVAMLVVSLTCDGTLNNWSEVIMREYRVGQDEFQLQLYTIAFLAMIFVTHVKGELVLGFEHFFLEAGTVSEIESSDAVGDDPTWTVRRKVLVLFFFSTTGLLGSSCAGAITKRFGALSMSITSTARKAMTLFLSFVAFHNTCTFEHVAGMVIFLGALLMKSLCAKANLDTDAAKKAMLHGSPSAMELDELSPGRHEDDEGDGDDDGVEDQEMRPLIHANGKEVDVEAAAVTNADAFQDNPPDSPNVSAAAAMGSLFETARTSPRLSSLFSYVRPRIHHGMNSSDGASHSS